MNVNLNLLRTSPTTALTKSYLAEAALQLLNEQDKAIASAVQAEREACAVLAGKAVMRVKTSTQAAHDMTLAEFRSVCSCAAEDAIRARNEVTK